MINESFYKGFYGLERETLRIDNHGRLALTPHPFSRNESITRDYCENQIEIITPVCESIDRLMVSLEELDNKVRKELGKSGEGLWLYSNPPHFENESEIVIADFTGELYKKRLYFEKLEKNTAKDFTFFQVFISIFPLMINTCGRFFKEMILKPINVTTI